jgi:hypothetical protein
MAKRRTKRPALPELTKEAEIELRHLRGLVKDIFRNCEAKLEARVEQATEDLLQPLPANADAVEIRRRESLLKAALALVVNLRVKPEKGRYRDTKRVYGVVTELVTLAARMQ